ncbi:hypothetical protein CN395_25050 [Priestia megaterium]|uniref:hypothetical protein n=1 Tax=Priestia megaterium TaxID=1404 RepID=UPI000BF9BF13|nr:hypothetical protein [Priestia megaterium]PEU54960.1 hypothetical protein CN395_25050 [Priestia megaterium]
MGKDPFGAIGKLIDMITGKLTILCPIVGGCFLIFFCLQYLASGDSHEKSEQKRYMKGTFWIVVFATLGANALKWVAGQL